MKTETYKNTEVKTLEDSSNLSSSFNLWLIFGVISLYTRTPQTLLFSEILLAALPDVLSETPLGMIADFMSGIMKQQYQLIKLSQLSSRQTLFNKVCSLAANSSPHVLTERSAHAVVEEEEESSFFRQGHINHSADSPEMNETQLVRQWVSLDVVSEENFNSTYTQFLKAETKLPKFVSARGNIPSFAGNDVL